mmetsp:Transcript_44431/g.117929  ORF Transcript_44431/g.117929 Transcript_44431/m.117929 type:complete len:303 (+) Transcript_44431:839-1747(+)
MQWCVVWQNFASIPPRRNPIHSVDIRVRPPPWAKVNEEMRRIVALEFHWPAMNQLGTLIEEKLAWFQLHRHVTASEVGIRFYVPPLSDIIVLGIYAVHCTEYVRLHPVNMSFQRTVFPIHSDTIGARGLQLFHWDVDPFGHALLDIFCDKCLQPCGQIIHHLVSRRIQSNRGVDSFGWVQARGQELLHLAVHLWRYVAHTPSRLGKVYHASNLRLLEPMLPASLMIRQSHEPRLLLPLITCPRGTLLHGLMVRQGEVGRPTPVYPTKLGFPCCLTWWKGARATRHGGSCELPRTQTHKQNVP